METDKVTEARTQNEALSKRLFMLKALCGVWIGKTLIFLTRMLGRGGTTLPGRIALLIAPDISAYLAGQLTEGSLLITGTNGKTTTASLIKDILNEAGFKCIHNQAGSNMSWGVASTLVEAASITAYLRGDVAVLEVDEGSFPEMARRIKPRGVVATNIFRDQLDRFGEIDHIRDSIQLGLEALPPDGFQVINADDPSLAGFQNSNDSVRWHYGLELDLPPYAFQNTGRDIKTCPRCSTDLAYNNIHFAHLGHFYCPECKYKRPEPDFQLIDCETNAEGLNQLQIKTPEKVIEVTYPLPGIYNLYNVLAAVACAHGLNIRGDIIEKALRKAVPPFGRMELFKTDGKEIIMALIKNPVGANEVLRTILGQPGDINILIVINDNIADGRDISWLWDVDFEQLVTVVNSLSNVIVTGQRSWDMAVRLKYAGLDPDQIQVEEDSAKAVKGAIAKTKTDHKLFILPTYTAMLEIRRSLNQMGLGKPFWNEEN